MIEKLENNLVNLSSYLVALVLILTPFYAFLTVWLGSNLGHYTWIRLWTEVVLVVLTLAAASLLALDKKLARNLLHQKWFWLIVAFFALEVVWGIIQYLSHAVSLKALAYAWVVDSRYLLFFVDVYVIAGKNQLLAGNWHRLVFIPAGLVAIFAVLQFLVLPIDFLKHFGYSASTIFPYETINHNQNYIRSMSFLRGANPLGAYMLVVATLSAGWLLSLGKKSAWRGRAAYAGLFVLSLAALAFSFSRSAWLGVVVSLLLLAFIVAKSSTRKIMLVAGALGVIVIVIVFASLRDNPQFQNYVFHTQKNSAIKTNSDSGHLSALKNGFSDFVREPLGRGPGTSGPASIYNHQASPRNTENYYLMIGGEDGWLGLALMLAIFAMISVELARRKTILALGLLASFIGLAVVNLLLPAWTDVTLAYVFWGLAGIALASKSERKSKTT